MAGEQVFSAEIVSCLLASLAESGVTVAAKHFKLMSKMDGSKTPAAYEHLLRPVKKRAAVITKSLKNGEIDLDSPNTSRKDRKNGAQVNLFAESRRKAQKQKCDMTYESKEDNAEYEPSKKIKDEQIADEDEDEDGLI